ncbi:SidA/IucD/PvdA family monooxygenase [Longispora sp. K20-0274]|uniref:lysine N(6)-hydroxylase/L-ornithine N(5)-oxygenase family protein n=1 Tax=Longispora sp. K20-0274 TaxID=3088255 RepID=UPI00399B2B37
MSHREVELLAIGAGPSNLALAVGIEELAPADLAENTLVVEQHDTVAWQRGMLLPWTQSQVSFLKDLVTLRNPRSQFSFVNYLHATGRLDEFVNLGSFTPYRLEISDYLQWVSGALSSVRVEHGKRCARVTPDRADDGEIVGWNVQMADGDTIAARNLSIGIGRDKYVPEVFKGLPAERVIHSTEYSDRMAAVDPAAARRVIVVGGAQSAAEMVTATHQSLPDAKVTMVMRSIGLNGYESSRFTNELYYSSFIDEFHASAPEAREQMLREMHRSNYSGLAPGMLDNLYRTMYLERLTGDERLRMITMVDIVDAQYTDDEVVLTLLDRRTGVAEEVAADLVLLGTGFDREVPRVVRQLADAAGLDEVRVNRAYRLDIPGSDRSSVYLQGTNEATHGIADSLLSVLASRAQDIITDLVSRRGATELLAVSA